MHDQIGSTIALLNASGAQAATFAYSAYGAVTSSGTVTTPLQYTGQYTDAESRLVFLRARYYDPATAEFLTVDPDTDLTGTPYAYTGGNPLNAVDLSGRDWWNPFSWSSDTWSNIGTGALFGAAIVGTAACIILEPCGVGEGLALAGGGTLAASGISLGTVTAWGGPSAGSAASCTRWPTAIVPPAAAIPAEDPEIRPAVSTPTRNRRWITHISKRKWTTYSCRSTISAH